MNNDLISVILPVYNGEKTINNTIESILNQTHNNFQLIIVDDGSTDKTSDICKKYIGKNVEYYSNSNHGVSYSRNFALEKSKGKYLTFVDSDDEYENQYLEKMLTLMKQNNSDLVCCGYKTFDKIEKEFSSLKNIFSSKEDFVETLQNELLFNQIWNKMYKLDIIKKYDIKFDDELSIAEDWKFNIEYLSKIETFNNSSDILYKYRITNNGLGFKYRENIGTIKIDLVTEMLKKISNNIYTEFISRSYIKQYYSLFSTILDSRNKMKFSSKKKKIKEIILKREYIDCISKCNVKNCKMRLLLNILKSRNIFFIVIFSGAANLYDKIYKKNKLGL